MHHHHHRVPTGPEGDLATRRRLLQTSAVGFGHLAFRALLGEQAAAETASAVPSAAGAANPLAARPPHLPARAKRIVFLFL